MVIFLKFRVYNYNLKKMIYSTDYETLSDFFSEYPPIEDGRDSHPCDDYSEHMQFTGLEDSEGKEIYEWDIGVWKRPFNNGIATAYIMLHNGCFIFNDWMALNFVYLYEVIGIKIIGNRFENPELLEKIK